MSTSGEEAVSRPPYEVGVAIAHLDQGPAVTYDRRQDRTVAGIPGYENTGGAHRKATLVEKGEDTVNAATEAIARQIGQSAERIAKTISAQVDSASYPASMGLESVEISFGITLAAGIQAIFTTQAESSVQVTIKLRGSPEIPVPTLPGHPE